MLAFRKVLYSVNSTKNENSNRTHLFRKEHMLSQLKTANKTNARKLVQHMASTIYFREVTTKNGTVLESHPILKDFKTRLPHHLLGFIDIMHHILVHCKLSVFQSRLNQVCSFPDVKNETQLQKLVECHTPGSRVSMFLKSVCRYALPKKLWGTQENEAFFNKLIHRLVDARRYDKVHVNDIVNSMDISKMKWIKGNNRRDLLRTFLIWFFEIFVFEVIKEFFYVTEHCGFKNRLFYFRMEVWRKVVNLTIHKHTSSGVWLGVSTNHVKETPALFVARIVPKKTGTRVIFRKFSRASTHQLKKSAIDDHDKQLLQSLTKLWNTHPELQGSGGFGVNMIYKKWKNFVSVMKTIREKSIYFVKIDIRNCFDSIPQKKLLSILQDILGRFCTTSELLTSLKSSLGSSLILVGGKYFLKSKGIPQGWKLSSMLCNLFYAQFEKEELPQLMTKCIIGSEHCHLLMRIIDDFMLVTTDIKEANQFVRVMHVGYPEYGIEVNLAKTITNFQPSADIPSLSHITVIEKEQAFPWFGHLFLPANNLTCRSMFIGYGVGIDMARYGESGTIRDCISKSGDTSALSLSAENGMAMSIQWRLSRLCLDRDINSSSRLHVNAFEMSYLTTLQWLSHISGSLCSPRHSPSLFTLNRILKFHIAKKFEKCNRYGYNLGIEYVIKAAAFKAVNRCGDKLMKKTSKLELRRINALLHRNYTSRTRLRMLKRITGKSPSQLCRLKLS